MQAEQRFGLNMAKKENHVSSCESRRTDNSEVQQSAPRNLHRSLADCLAQLIATPVVCRLRTPTESGNFSPAVDEPMSRPEEHDCGTHLPDSPSTNNSHSSSQGQDHVNLTSQVPLLNESC
eukprot:CAMPEP_0178376446 /NCGR_PEP_ID=MMETSP0689_2-20121128/3408_1 /TAXON_ID=160604 /ORGANISM="Amphidinium massartii, Strain CS-259" /LENGTH=120 /DNA_ID=CAMNT_0019996471 /DNA_START=202 /DNA_END=564 /DNA_ORIENTATION=+